MNISITRKVGPYLRSDITQSLKKVASFTWLVLPDALHLPLIGYNDARHTTHGTLLRAQSTWQDQLKDTRTNLVTMRTSGKIPASGHNEELSILSLINNFYLYQWN